MITICVKHQSSGNSASSKKVFISFGSTWLEEYTNSNGVKWITSLGQNPVIFKV